MRPLAQTGQAKRASPDEIKGLERALDEASPVSGRAPKRRGNAITAERRGRCFHQRAHLGGQKKSDFT